MKNMYLLLALIGFCSSCTKDYIDGNYNPKDGNELTYEINPDPTDGNKLTYELNQDQETIIEVEVVPTEGVELDYQGMVEEANADYYNRYGIALKFSLRQRENLPDAVKDTATNQIFLPHWVSKEKKEKLTVYVVPEKYLHLPVYAYAHIQSNSVILGEKSQVNRTLSHEIGHLLGLYHTTIPNNVMTPLSIAGQKDIPNDFDEAQIDTMMVNFKHKDFKFPHVPLSYVGDKFYTYR